jgi:hypothetical protein
MKAIGYCIILWWFFAPYSALAQLGGFGSIGSSGGAQQQSAAESDTIAVQYFFPDNVDLLYSFKDTLLNNYFEQYDPTRQQVIDYAQLGNLGTPTIAQFYQPRWHKDLDIGFHQFDLYKIDHEDLRFYKTDKPFSDLYFTQGPGQQNTFFKAKFTRDFSEGINFSIDYKRMNNDGQFKSQAAINTNLAFGFWYRGKNDKYDGFLTYTSNTHDIEDNGGIPIDDLTQANQERVFNIPVFLRSANTYHVSRSVAYNQQYNLAGAPDSAQVQTQRNFKLHHSITYKNNRYKFSDTDPPADSIYYKHLLLDDRGLRYYFEDRSIENSFAISTSKSGSDTQRDFLKVGIEHQLHFLEQEPLDSSINHVILRGQWNFAPSDRMNVKTHLMYNLLANIGDYRIGGDLYLDFKKVGNFEASLVNQLYSPTLLQQRMIISEQTLWQNNFDKTLETNLSATYRIPKLRFSVTGQYHLINKLVYFDTLALPRQSGDLINVLQLAIQQNFKLRNFHLNNTVAVQASSSDVLRLPELFSKHNLYYEGKIFKDRMLLRLGLDLRMVNAYKAYYYQPLIGQFHLQEQQTIPFYPALDAYTSFKVQHFRFFVRAENLTRFLDESTLYYQVAGYAQPYFFIKFGLSWQLLN